jgi:hypothetical protein
MKMHLITNNSIDRADFLQSFTAEFNSIRNNLLNEIELSIDNAVNRIIYIYKSHQQICALDI